MTHFLRRLSLIAPIYRVVKPKGCSYYSNTHGDQKKVGRELNSVGV